MMAPALGRHGQGRARVVHALAACCALGAAPAAGQVPVAAPAETLPFTIEGPAPPRPPNVIAKDEAGRTTVRAVRLELPLRIDGALDEAVYGDVLPMSDFVQIEPREGSPGSQ